MTTWLTDAVVGHLRSVASWPDVSGTKYVVVDEIGRGGMGTVYRAVDTELGRDVALKVINTAGDHATLAARLALEARVLARLDHPGVVPVHECGVLADGRAFYVMKLVRGELLDGWLARTMATATTAADAAWLDQRLRLFERITEPVAFAHAHGIVHRDLKPRNVMIGPFGEVLVMDWGAARIMQRGPAAPAAPAAPAGALSSFDDVEANTIGDGPFLPGDTQIGTVIGTPGYMAPEQARGSTADVDARADVYALGALLVQMLIAQPDASSPARAGADSIRATTLSDGDVPVTADAPHAAAIAALARVAGVPKRLRAICAKALAPRPADRYHDAGALAADIARFRAGEPVQAYPETWFDRAARFYGTYRTAILLLLAYLTMRVLFVIFWRH